MLFIMSANLISFCSLIVDQCEQDGNARTAYAIRV